MNCHISNEINYPYEATRLISMHYEEDKGYRNWLSKALEKSKDSESWLVPMLTPLITIEEEVFADYSVSERDFQLYFQAKDTAASNLGSTIIASLFCDMENYLSEENQNEKKKVFASYMLPDFPYVKDAAAPGTEEFFRLLQETAAEPACKWDCFEIYCNLEEHLKLFQNILAPVIQVLRKHEAVLLKLIQDYHPTETPFYLQDTQFLGNLHAKEVMMDFTVFGFNGLTMYMLDIQPDVGYLHYGLYVDLFIRENAKKESAGMHAADKWKSLSDKSRIKILCLLKEREMFGQELKEALGLSNATISHHMNELVVDDFVSLRKDGNKVIYSLNREKIGEALECMRHLLLD